MYYEEVTPPIFFQYFLYAVIGLLGYIALTGRADIPPMLGAIGLIIVYAISSIFGRLTIVITESMLTVGFGFLKYRIALDNIDYVEVRSFPWKYGGFGVRFAFDWSVGYIQNYNRGVKVVPKKGRTLFFSTNRPDDVADKLVEMSRVNPSTY